MSDEISRPVLGEIPAELREPLDIVLGDLQGDRPIEIRVGYDDRPDKGFFGPEPVLWFLEPGNGGTGYAMFEEKGPELLVRMADHLQEQFFPETRQAWGEARPACPGHTHPAVPAVVESEAWWTCPASGRAIARFGTLRTP